jgi:hypothetical protein
MIIQAIAPFSSYESGAQSALNSALNSTQEALAKFALEANFLENLEVAFGNDFSLVDAISLQNQWLNHDFGSIPQIEIRTNDELRGAFGAYSALTDTIYLNQNFLEDAHTEQVVAVLLEEIGHSVDVRLNSQDSLGDEGEIFSALAWGQELNSGQLSTLRFQDDSTVLNIDGMLIPVEMSSLIGEQVDVDVRFTTFADSFVDVSLFSTTFTVGAGSEVANQSVSTTFQGGGFPQTLSGTVSIDVSVDTIFARFSGTAQPGEIKFIFSSLVGGPVNGIDSVTEINKSGTMAGVIDTRSPTVSSNVVTTGFLPLGFQPGVAITQTSQLGFSTTDTTAPTLTSFTRQNPAANLTNANSLIFQASFNEDVQNVDFADFSVNGSTATVTTVTQVNASTYNVTVSGGNLASFNGTVGLNLANGQNIQDLAGNALPDTEPSTDQTYTLDNVAPTVTVDIVDASLSDTDNASQVAFTFSETVSGFTVADLTVAGGTICGFSGSGDSYTATFTAGDNSTTAGSVIVNANSYTDTAGNSGASGSDTVTVDTDNPTVTVDIVDASLSDADNASQVTFTFSETVSGFTSADLTVAGGTLSGFSGSGDSYTATFTADDDSTTLGSVTVNANSYTDIAGNTGASGNDTVTVDTVNPTVLGVTPSLTAIQDANVGSGTFSLTVDFSEAMNPSVDPAIAFPTTGEDPTNTLTFVSGSWSDADTYVATYNVADANEMINTIDVQVNGGQDLAGNSHISSTQADEFSIDMVSAIAFSSATFTSAENVGTSNTVTLTRTGDTSGAASVQVSITGGSATGNGTDYTSSSFPVTVNFAANETSQTVAIPINDDLLDEVDETITLNLGSASNAILGAQTTTILTITDNDAVPNLSIDDVMVNEGDGTAIFTVSLDAPSGKAISVDYATADDTATAGSDYDSASGTLNVAAGETSKTVTVNVSDDSLDEIGESFFVNLSGATNAAIADNQGQATITDNDLPPNVSLSLADSPFDENGGIATVTATLDAVSSLDVDINLTFAGSATEGTGNDYSTSSSLITILAGTLSNSITLTGLDDSLDEGTETVIVDIDSVTNGTDAGGTQQVTANITDDDVSEVIITPISLDVAEGGATGSYEVRLSTIPTDPVSIAFDGGTDVGAIAPLTFAADATALVNQPVTITATDDDIAEGDHTQLIAHSVTSNDAKYDNLAVESMTVAIADNDIDYAIGVSATAINETDRDGQTITVSLSRSGDLSQVSSVEYLLAGTATLGSDYSIASSGNRVSFAIGETTQSFNINILGDVDIESDETIDISLLNGTAPGTPTFSQDKVAVRLINDDGATGAEISDITFRTGNPNNVIRGTSGNDVLRGTPQSDVLRGGTGNDRILGGRKRHGFGQDQLLGNAGNDVLKGGKGKDYLDGGTGDDKLKGGNNRDVLIGGRGNDILIGDKGKDILIGGKGNDIIKGGKGIDMVTYKSLREGKDTLIKFNVSQDVIDLRDIFSNIAFSATSSFKQFQNYIDFIQVGNGTELRIDQDGNGLSNQTVTLALLKGVRADTLSAKNVVLD